MSSLCVCVCVAAKVLHWVSVFILFHSLKMRQTFQWNVRSHLALCNELVNMWALELISLFFPERRWGSIDGRDKWDHLLILLCWFQLTILWCRDFCLNEEGFIFLQEQSVFSISGAWEKLRFVLFLHLPHGKTERLIKDWQHLIIRSRSFHF